MSIENEEEIITNEQLLEALNMNTPLTEEQINAMKQKAYIQYLKNLEYSKTYRDKNKGYIRKYMINYYLTPEYKERNKQNAKLMYYKKKHGCQTFEDIEKFKQMKKEKNEAEFEELIKNSVPFEKRKKRLDFEQFSSKTFIQIEIA
jgi:hypothetical protein